MLNIQGKTCVFVDGFNLYHGIKQAQKNKGVQGTHQLPSYKWLCLSTLCHAYIPPQHLDQIRYYSAFAFHAGQAGVQRHRDYMAALRSTDIHIVMGRFKEKRIRCQAQCRQEFLTHEEKETDVNLAIDLVEAAILGSCDAIVVVSGDTDILPALKRARQHGKKVFALFPPHRKNDDLATFCDDHATIKAKALARFLLPDPVYTEEGKQIGCPAAWK